MSQKLTLAELESHLWGAADILRGRITASAFMHYIFSLLFFKRLSDVWEEEFEAALQKYKDQKLAADPDEHRFHIPKGCFWNDVCKVSTNIGEAINASLRNIEDKNEHLKGVFQDVDFNNKEKFPDQTLQSLLNHFSKYRMRNADVEADVLGNAYEYLIAKFADDAGARGGEFYTPKMVVRLIVECVEPQENQEIYDPTCGSGGMLLEAYHSLELATRFAERLGLPAPQVRAMQSNRYWGLCESDGSLKFDWHIVELESRQIEKIVAHEVAHLVERNHGAAFHRLQEQLRMTSDLSEVQSEITEI
jgi:type I restriction enzyme M protein